MFTNSTELVSDIPKILDEHFDHYNCTEFGSDLYIDYWHQNLEEKSKNSNQGLLLRLVKSIYFPYINSSEWVPAGLGKDDEKYFGELCILFESIYHKRITFELRKDQYYINYANNHKYSKTSE